MAKQKCCPKPFIIKEIIQGGSTTPPTPSTFIELRDDGGYELADNSTNELID